MARSLKQHLTKHPIDRDKIDAHKERMLGEVRAHPLCEPKPWEQAQPGELWYLEDLSKGGAYLVVKDDFGNEFIGQSCRFSTKFIGITTGRRIWPEEPHE
jgi:hypothetical protein